MVVKFANHPSSSMGGMLPAPPFPAVNPYMTPARYSSNAGGSIGAGGNSYSQMCRGGANGIRLF